MPADTGASSDATPNEESDDAPRDELWEAIAEFDEGETPSEDEVREAFLS